MNLAAWNEKAGVLFVAVARVMNSDPAEYYVQVVDDVDLLSCEVVALLCTHRVPIEEFVCLSPLQALKLYVKSHITGKLEFVADYEIDTEQLESIGVIWHGGDYTKFIDMEVTE